MTKSQAREWVHTQLIVDELDCEQLVAAFTVLAEHAPDAVDRRQGMFRRCCEMVIASSHAATPPAASGTSVLPTRAGAPLRRTRSIAS